ncbi:MAG TPA: hypothetical protein VN156_15730, partial [Pseudomonas sp.]|nr:hypothetical protein [Pseudomonas sp.]
MARDTVIGETPALAATSFTVTGIPPPSPSNAANSLRDFLATSISASRTSAGIMTASGRLCHG